MQLFGQLGYTFIMIVCSFTIGVIIGRGKDFF